MTDGWRPTDPDEIRALVAEALLDCGPEERALFEKLRVPIRTIPIVRLGKTEDVLVVAKRAGRVLFWDDVEEGFELAAPDPDGVLREYGRNQFELKHVMRQLLSEAVRYPCPCCGYLVFDEPPGSYDICVICNWEDDVSQLRFPNMAGGANKLSLLEAQRMFQEIGASDHRFVDRVRIPTPGDIRDRNWRPIDPNRDDIERAEAGVDYGPTYPNDTTVLYYWQATFWRRAR